MAKRKQIEERIIQLISYINHKETMIPLVWSLKFFSLEELLQLKDFLESWSYKTIYILIDKKIKEYLFLIKEIREIKIKEKMKKLKMTENNENIQKEEELSKILKF
jgi:hypothetical protein